MGIRRDQILRGAADPTIPPTKERRRSPRDLPAVGTARPLIGSQCGRVENASSQGLGVVADTKLGIGDSVPVKVIGREVVGARIVWKRGNVLGLSFHGDLGANL